jgi:hypothetical protein
MDAKTCSHIKYSISVCEQEKRGAPPLMVINMLLNEGVEKILNEFDGEE